ncbi:YceI family protein [Corynebacterium uropygiale]|uniref:YceI family protein n=1 Tax=Corynebacterium uropygiale TaxID=1775911 RepID=A0A9X1QSF9_9CORY|nr:YceI family protein [Corynebacterium uropygiale]MCF4006928.1 YceI family protein [Corynebacterium uropygiale]
MSTFAGTWTLDAAHSEVGFVVRHAMVTKVRGHFSDVSAQITINGEDLSSAVVEGTVATASLDTGNKDRDAHVRGEDFFDVENHPEMTFRSTSVSVNGESGTVTGDLTIKGVTKQVTFDVEVAGVAEDPFGATRMGFEASTRINRKDFGVDFQAPLKTGGVLLSEDVTIQIEGSATKA